jgi:hypothetical protein
MSETSTKGIAAGTREVHQIGVRVISSLFQTSRFGERPALSMLAADAPPDREADW